jgi:hypothetical protein
MIRCSEGRLVVLILSSFPVHCTGFALAHVSPFPADAGELAAFFVLNAALVPAILYTALRSEDVIWIGLVHYRMDMAIEAI